MGAPFVPRNFPRMCKKKGFDIRAIYGKRQDFGRRVSDTKNTHNRGPDSVQLDRKRKMRDIEYIITSSIRSPRVSSSRGESQRSNRAYKTGGANLLPASFTDWSPLLSDSHCTAYTEFSESDNAIVNCQ